VKEAFERFALMLILIVFLMFAFILLSIVEGKSPGTSEWKTSIASWYGLGFEGKITASGEIYNKYALTVAHKKLPFNTIIEINYNRRSVYARVNDRGPYVAGRELDLSYMTAKLLEFDGVQEVTWRVIFWPEEQKKNSQLFLKPR